MANYYLVTPPTSEPFTLEQAKTYLRVDNDDENDVISNIITAAREKVESLLWRPLLTQQWKLLFDTLSSGFIVNSDLYLSSYQYPIIYINKCPIQSIDSVKYIDVNGTTQTLSTSKYEVDLLSEPSRIRIIEMPQIKADTMNAFWIEFTAGYTDAALIPSKVKQAMQQLMGHYYEHRESVIVGTISSEIEMSTEYLLQEFKNNLFIYNN